MTEPIDPNALPPQPPPPYEPPPPMQPPPAYRPSPMGQAPVTAPVPAVGQPSWPAAYGPPPWQTEPVPPAWPAPPPPSNSSRNLVIAIVAAVVLAAAGIGGYFVFRGAGSSGKKIALPASFDGYTELHNSQADRVVSIMRSVAGSAGGSDASTMLNRGSFGVYAKNSGDQPVLITFAIPTGSLPASVGTDPDAVTSGMLTIAGGSNTYPAGPHGGVLRCASTQVGIASETMCAWSDGQTTGLVLSISPDATSSGIASVANDLRDRID